MIEEKRNNEEELPLTHPNKHMRKRTILKYEQTNTHTQKEATNK